MSIAGFGTLADYRENTGRWKGIPEGLKLLGVSDADLQHLDTDSDGKSESGLTETTFDTVSDAAAANIVLTNSTGSSITLRSVVIKAKAVYQEGGEDGLLVENIDWGDVEKNGELSLKAGSDCIVQQQQGVDIADWLWKNNHKEMHIYSFDLPGKWPHLRVGGRYRIEIGAGGQTEFIDSWVDCTRVTSQIGRHGISTTVTFQETAEGFKFDSSAIAKIWASGRFPNSITVDRIIVGAKYYAGEAHVYLSGSADQTFINTAIKGVHEAFGGGTVHLTNGWYYTSAAIAMYSDVILESEGGANIEITGDDYVIKGDGASGTEITGFTIRNINLSRNDANTKSMMWFDYCDSFTLDNVRVNESNESGIFLQNCDEVIIQNCIVSAFKKAGIDASTSNTKVSVIDCYITNATPTTASAGIYSSVSGYVSGCRIDGITTSNLDYRLIEASNNSTVIGCHLSACTLDSDTLSLCIRLRDNCIASANTIRDITEAGPGIGGIYIDSEGGQAMITDNTITGITADRSVVAISCSDILGTVQGNKISAIAVDGASGAGGVTGIAIGAAQVHCVKNTIHELEIDNAANGEDVIGISQADDGVNDVHISENTIFDMAITAGSGDASGIYIGSAGSNGTITGNLIISCDNFGIFNAMDNVAIAANYCGACDTGIEIHTTADKNGVTGNMLLGNTSDALDDNGTNTTTTGNVVA